MRVRRKRNERQLWKPRPTAREDFVAGHKKDQVIKILKSFQRAEEQHCLMIFSARPDERREPEIRVSDEQEVRDGVGMKRSAQERR